MKRNILFLLLITTLTVGCSAKKTASKEASVDLTELEETPIEAVEADSVIPLETEVMASNETEPEELIVEVEPDSLFDDQDRFTSYNEADEEKKEEILAATTSELSGPIAEEENEAIVDINDSDFISATEDVGQEITKVIEKSEYVVQKNDTLMLVSWKIYGDTSRWRELKSMNPKKIHNGNIWTGEKLSFNRPEVEFNWSPEGTPYLIGKGDTLGGISKEVYSEAKYWQAIWYNNRDLIRDPDLIFAGFTIFYQDLEKINHREIASKIKMFKKKN